MCGRATLVTDVSEIAEIFNVDPIVLPPLNDKGEKVAPPRFNIAPSQSVLIVRPSSSREGQGDAPVRELVLVKWGLVPFWAKDPKIGHRHVQARAETAAKTAAYREAFKSRRCLFIVDGFYEWSTEEQPPGPRGGKTKPIRKPHHVTRTDHRPLAIAAVWDRWKTPDGGRLESCAVLTTDAEGAIVDVHDRMPLVLDPDEQAAWLASADEAAAIVDRRDEIAKAAARDLVVTRVGTWVNDVKHEDPRCIEPETPRASGDDAWPKLSFD